MSTPTETPVSRLVNEFLSLVEDRNNAEAARLVGVDKTTMGDWRSEGPPERLQERTRVKLLSAVAALRVGKGGALPGSTALPATMVMPTLSMLETIGRAHVAIQDLYRLINVNFTDLPPREVNEFGWRVREARLAAGLSEAAAAAAIGERTAQSVQNIEHGAVRPHQMDAARRTKMAKGLKTTVDRLFAGFPLPPDRK